MPHVGSSSTDDLASSDEIKHFKDEGEDEKPASVEALKELKTSLITEGDQKSSQSFTSKSSGSQQPPTLQNGQRTEGSVGFGKAFDTPLSYSPFGYSLPHSPYHPNGAFSPMTNKMAVVDSGTLPFMMPNMERLPQPPPAHMGIPPVHIETKSAVNISWMEFASGIARNSHLYSQYTPSVLTDLTQQLQWTNPAMYMQSAAFRGPYHPQLGSVSAASFPSFGRTPIMPHPSFSGQFPTSSFLQAPSSSNVNGSNIGNGSTSQKSSSRSSASLVNGANLLANGATGAAGSGGTGASSRMPGTTVSLTATNSANAIRGEDLKPRVHSGPGNGNKSKSSHSMSNGQNDRDQKIHQIKKPLNAFMIFMKEERARVIAETTMKESAQINQILGKKWHSLTRTEQEKYYEKARKEKELHMERHPGWTAKDNYAVNGKRKKKKRERNADGERGAAKKCRARYGLDQQNQWCKPCRRKKKCVRVYQETRRGRANDHEDNLGSVGSVDAPTPESKSANESDHDNLNLSSTDLSLSSPPTAEYHPFMNSFTHYSSGSALNPPSSSHLHLNGNGHLPSPALFYPHASSSSTSLSSPLGSRMSSLLTPNSPLTAVSAGLGPFPTSLPSSTATVLHSAPSTTSHSQVPPRNSPFSIEQLARPHCPSSQHRSSPLSSSSIGSSTSKQSHESVNVPVITSLPTPPSSTDSTASATPAMLSVA